MTKKIPTKLLVIPEEGNNLIIKGNGVPSRIYIYGLVGLRALLSYVQSCWAEGKTLEIVNAEKVVFCVQKGPKDVAEPLDFEFEILEVVEGEKKNGH